MLSNYSLLTLLVVVLCVVAIFMRETIATKFATQKNIVLGVAIVALIAALYYGRNIPKEMGIMQ